MHYILKPFSALDIKEALKRVRKKEKHQITLNLTGGGAQVLDICEILYIESVGHIRVVHAKSGVFNERERTLSSFLSLFETIAPRKFIEPYRGYVINLDYVKSVTSGNIIMTNDEAVLIKRGDFRRIKNIVFDYAFKGGDR